MKCTFSRQEFLDAVRLSSNIREALLYLSLRGSGGNYQTFHKFAQLYQVDISHFNQTRKNVPQPSRRRPIEEYLSNSKPILSDKLKKRLIREGYKQHQCEKCLGIEWQGLRIPIELDHIDGNHLNNELSNLRILCPNCHAQTDTYSGKNAKKHC